MKNLLVLIIVFLSTRSYSQSFLGITIDGSQETVKAKLLQKGFKLTTADKDLYQYKGLFNGDDVSISVVNTPKSKKVYAFLIVFEKVYNSWSSLESEFNSRNSILQDKYGEPSLKKREYEYPFEPDDKYSLLALESDKLVYYNLWYSVGESQNLTIILNLNKDKTVSMYYQNKRNKEIEEAEKSLQDLNDY